MKRRRFCDSFPIRPRVAVLVAAAVVVAGCTARHRDVEGERVLVHVVEPGDTVEDLADDYYGDRERAREIRRFNEIGREEDVEAGTKLRIPMSPEDIETLGQRRRARVPYNEGLRLAAKGSLVDASSKFRQALELDPRFAEAHFNLGVTYQRIKAHEKALDELSAAARLRPDDADYLYAVGGAYFHLERFDRAVAEFERAVALDPFHAKARFSLAASYERLGRVDDARRAWRRYLEVDDESEWADEARARLNKLGRP